VIGILPRAGFDHVIDLAGHPKEGTITFVAFDTGGAFFLKEFEIRAVFLVTAPALDAVATMFC